MRWSNDDIDNMRAALAEAGVAAQEGEVPVGAVVVVNNEVIASGRNNSVSALQGVPRV